MIGQYLGFVRRYGRFMTRQQLAIALASPALLSFYPILTAPTTWGAWGQPALRRTYIGTTEPMDITYTPAFPVASHYAHYFRPTMLTDNKGCLTEALTEDLQNSRPSVDARPPLVSLASRNAIAAVAAPPAK
jgi:hypothetical protein